MSKALVKHNERLREHKRSTGKEPHVRRAHWHKYWCGSGDNRRQELRWVKSTIVGLSKIKKRF